MVCHVGRVGPVLPPSCLGPSGFVADHGLCPWLSRVPVPDLMRCVWDCVCHRFLLFGFWGHGCQEVTPFQHGRTVPGHSGSSYSMVCFHIYVSSEPGVILVWGANRDLGDPFPSSELPSHPIRLDGLRVPICSDSYLCLPAWQVLRPHSILGSRFLHWNLCAIKCTCFKHSLLCFDRCYSYIPSTTVRHRMSSLSQKGPSGFSL